MTTAKKNTLKAFDISIRSRDRDKIFLVSNLNLHIEEGKSLAMYFKNKEEKLAFMSLLRNGNVNYSGIFSFGDKLYNHESKLNDIFRVENPYVFSSDDLLKRNIEIATEYILKNFQDSHNVSFKTDRSGQKTIDTLRTFEFKKIEYSFLKSIDNLHLKNIKLLKDLVLKMKNINTSNIEASKNEVVEIMKNFNDVIKFYLDEKTLYLIKKNILIINLYLKKYSNLEIIKRNSDLYSKIFKLLYKIDNLDHPNASLTKIKNRIYKLFSLTDSKMEKNKGKNFQFYKATIDSIIHKLKFKVDIYNSRLKPLDKYSADYLYYYKRKTTCLYFIDFIRKEQHKFKYLENEEMENFWVELMAKYRETVAYGEKNINVTMGNIKKYFKEEVASTMAPVVDKFFMISNKNKSQLEAKEMKMKDDDKINRTSVNANKILVEAQDLLDEIEWETESLSNINNKKIFDLSVEIVNFNKLCNKNADIFNGLINQIINRKNKIFKKHKISNLDEDAINAINGGSFAKISKYYEDINKYILLDRDDLEALIVNKDSINKDREYSLIIKYKIFDYFNKMSLRYVDLFKQFSRDDIFFQNLMLIISTLFEKRNIIVLENIFSNIDHFDLQKMEMIFNIISHSSKKIWIFIEDDLSKMKDIPTDVSIIDNSKQIEFGPIDQIMSNPIYDTTREAFKISPLENHATPAIFNNIIDCNINYDDYVVDNEHRIFGNIGDIHSWTNAIPAKSTWTILIDEWNNFNNKINFDKFFNTTITNKKSKSKKIKKNTNTKEFMIINVEK